MLRILILDMREPSWIVSLTVDLQSGTSSQVFNVPELVRMWRHFLKCQFFGTLGPPSRSFNTRKNVENLPDVMLEH